MNQAVNFFWTILCFAPVVAYWVASGALLWCFIFIGISVMSQLIPGRLLQLSTNPKWYEGLGVKFIRKFVQHGEYVNRMIRKTQPGYGIIKHKANAAQYLKTIVMYERFHLICFILFLLTTIHSLINHYDVLAFLMLGANIIYNICPILLQQYNRARVLKLRR